MCLLSRDGSARRPQAQRRDLSGGREDRIEDELSERGANYVQGGLFKAFAVRDGRLITGQQQYSARKVAEMLIDALGV